MWNLIFFTIGKANIKTKQNRFVLWQIWPAALEFVTSLSPGPVTTQHKALRLVACWWVDGLHWTWLLWGPFSYPLRTLTWTELTQCSESWGWRLLFSHLLAPSPDGKFLPGSLAGVRNVSMGSLGWENWNWEFLKVSHPAWFHFPLICIYSSFSFLFGLKSIFLPREFIGTRVGLALPCSSYSHTKNNF